MTEEERKEFEEFQKWKEEKKKKEALIQGETNTPSEDGSLIKEDSKPKDNNASSDKPVEGKQVSSVTSILIYMGVVVGVIVILCMFVLSTNESTLKSGGI